MLKNLSPLLLLTFFACAPPNQIKTLDISESSYSRDIVFESIQDKIVIDSLEIKISPLAPVKADSLFYREHFKSGQLQFASQSYGIAEPPRKESELEDHIDYDPLANALNKLLEQGQINPSQKWEFLQLLEPDGSEGKKSSELDINELRAYNPYYIGGKYLSPFKIEFHNKSKRFKTFRNKFQILNDGQLLRPLPTEFLKEELHLNRQGNADYTQALERFNLSDSLLIPPGANFEKYFALLPISFNAQLEITHPQTKAAFKYNMQEDFESLDTIYSFYVLPLNSTYHGGNEFYYKNYIIYESQAMVFLENKKLHVSTSDLDKSIKISWLALNGSTGYFGTKTFKAQELLEIESNTYKPLLVTTKLIK